LFNDPTFIFCVNAVVQADGGYNLVYEAQYQSQMKMNYLEIYLRVVDSIRCHPYFDENGSIGLLNSESSTDLTGIFGPRFPDEVYYSLCLGMISPQVLNNMISLTLVESAPLCNGETREYRDYLKSLMPLRTDAFSLVSTLFPYCTKDRNVSCYYWFENQEKETFHAMIYSYDSLIFRRLKNKISDLPEVPNRSHHIAFSDSLDLCLEKNINNLPPNNPLSQISTSQVISRILTHTLESREFIAQNQLTEMGKVLQLSDVKYVEEIFLALELLKSGQLHGNPYTNIKGEPIKKIESNPLRLISRVFCLLPMVFKTITSTSSANTSSSITPSSSTSSSPSASPASSLSPSNSSLNLSSTPNPTLLGWTKEVDYELLCFNSVLKSLTRSLRNLCEMITLSLFILEPDALGRNDIKEIYFGLPFGNEISTASGILIKYHLSHYGKAGYSVEQLKEVFPSCDDPIGTLKSGYAFWNDLFKAVVSLEKSQLYVSKGLLATFQEGNQLLMNARI